MSIKAIQLNKYSLGVLPGQGIRLDTEASDLRMKYNPPIHGLEEEFSWKTLFPTSTWLILGVPLARPQCPEIWPNLLGGFDEAVFESAYYSNWWLWLKPITLQDVAGPSKKLKAYYYSLIEGRVTSAVGEDVCQPADLLWKHGVCGLWPTLQNLEQPACTHPPRRRPPPDTHVRTNTCVGF